MLHRNNRGKSARNIQFVGCSNHSRHVPSSWGRHYSLFSARDGVLMRAIPLLSVALVIGSSLPAMAANCKSSGGLLYLGNTRDGSRSVWLSRTDLGSFELEAAQGNQTVDTWAVPPQRRLHLLSLAGGFQWQWRHPQALQTSGNQPCLIDTHNQKRGWHFPSLPPRPDPHPRPDPGPAPILPDFGPRPDVGPAPIPPDFGPGPDVGPAPFHLISVPGLILDLPPFHLVSVPGLTWDPPPFHLVPAPGLTPDLHLFHQAPAPGLILDLLLFHPVLVQHRSRSRYGSRMAPWCAQSPG